MTTVPYPLTLGLHSQTDIVAALNDLHLRLSAIEAIWSAHSRSHDIGDTLVADRIEQLEAWAKQFPPLGVISDGDGKPQSVTGPATWTIRPAAPGSDAAADNEILEAELASIRRLNPSDQRADQGVQHGK